MNFSPNKTPIEIIKEGAFGGTYFRDIYFFEWNKSKNYQITPYILWIVYSYRVYIKANVLFERFRCRTHPFSRTTYDVLHL